MTLFDAMVNVLGTIAVYIFVGFLIYNAFKTVMERFKPKEPPMQDTGGMDYE